MNIKNPPPHFLPFYAVYVVIIQTIVAFLITTYTEDFKRSPFVILLAIVLLSLLPAIALYLANSQGSIAKWLRLIVFTVTKVRVFAIFGLVSVLTLTIALFLLIVAGNSNQSVQILMNVFLLNVLLAVLFLLILVGRFEIKQPADLLIEKLQGDGKVFLFRDGVLRHIPDPPTLNLLGYSINDAVKVTDKEFQAYTLRSPIESVATAQFVQDRSGIVWYTTYDERRRVPDPNTLEYIKSINTKPITSVSEETLMPLQESKPLVSIVSRAVLLIQLSPKAESQSQPSALEKSRADRDRAANGRD